MVSKCANPKCSEPFLRLREGKLFRWDGADDKRSPRGRVAEGTEALKVEFFWLCGTCAQEMKLVFKAGVGVTTTALDDVDRTAREGGTTLEWHGTPRAVRSSESAISREPYAIRRAAG